MEEELNAWQGMENIRNQKTIDKQKSQKGNQVQGWQKFSMQEQGISLKQDIEGNHITAWKQFKDQPQNLKINRQKPLKSMNTIQKQISLINYFLSTMPDQQKWVNQQNVVLRIINAMFRGIAQVVFCNNPISGIIITIAIFISSIYQGLFMLLGVFCSSVVSLILQMDKSSFENGLYGYNGCLVGLGISLFSFGGDQKFLELPQLICPIIFMSMVSTIVQAGIGSIFVQKFNLSPFTMPFILTVWIWIGAAQNFNYFPLNGNILEPKPQNWDLIMPNIMLQKWNNYDILQSIFKGISQIYFQSNTISGILILIAIAIFSPISSFFAFLGSLTCVVTAIGLGVDQASLYFGLWGYSGSLTGIALGGMFFVLNGYIIYFYTISACILTTIVHGYCLSILNPVGIPVLTFPFVLVTWIFLLAGTSMKPLFSVELAALSTAEDHKKLFKKITECTSKFSHIQEFQEILNIKDLNDLNKIEQQLVPVLLCHYASIGDLDNIKLLKSHGVDLNLSDYDKRSALQLAIAEQQMHIVLYLLEKNANVDQLDIYFETALNDAIRSKNFEIVKQIKKYSKSELKMSNFQKNSQQYMVNLQLLISASQNDIQTIKCLQLAGVNISSCDYDGRTALHIAVCQNNEKLCQQLMSLGADINIQDKFGNSPLKDAEKLDLIEIKKILLNDNINDDILEQKYIKIKKNDVDTKKVLISVVISNFVVEGNQQLILQILNKITQPLEQFFDYDLRTPLHVAINNNQLDIAKILILKGANINAEDRWGQTPLWEAIQNKYKKCIKLLLKYNAKINFTDEKLCIIICQIVSQNNYDLIQTMIYAKINLNVKDYDERTPLHIAGDLGYTKIYQALIDNGADIDSLDRWNQKPQLIGVQQKL